VEPNRKKFFGSFFQKITFFFCFLPDARALCSGAVSLYAASMAEPVTYADFEKLDIRVGTVVDAKPFPQARKPALQLWIDFGPEVGVKKSSAQITVHYKPDQLIGRQVCAVVNFPPRQIGPFISEVLTLGLPGDEGEVVLAKPDFKVPDGGRLF
jgi:tRNA-binding protein